MPLSIIYELILYYDCFIWVNSVPLFQYVFPFLTTSKFSPSQSDKPVPSAELGTSPIKSIDKYEKYFDHFLNLFESAG